jgi:hypothetical protein
MVSALTVPEMFDENSANSANDFIKVLGNDSNFSFLGDLVKALAEELTTQDALEEVSSKLFAICYDSLDPSPPPAHRSIDDSLQNPVRAILQLCSGDKRFVRWLALAGEFLLIYICNFHVLSHLLLIYICKLHWNLYTMFVCQVIFF